MTGRLVLVRHGETAWNAENRFQGQADEPLNATGWEQARAAAPALAGLGIDELWSSPLSRARQTASLVGALAKVPVWTDDRLREVNVGSWSGRTVDEVAASEPEYLPKWRAGEDFRRSSTGETEAEVADRMGEFLSSIVSADGRTVCVVGHGFALRVGIAKLLAIPARLLATLGNCHVAVVDVPGQHLRLSVLNIPAECLGVGGSAPPAQ